VPKAIVEGKISALARSRRTVKQELLAHEIQVLLAGGDPAWIGPTPQWRRVPLAVP